MNGPKTDTEGEYAPKKIQNQRMRPVAGVTQTYRRLENKKTDILEETL